MTVARLEGLGKLKNPVTSAGIEPSTFRLVYLVNLNKLETPLYIEAIFIHRHSVVIVYISLLLGNIHVGT
jgi:hypothetical protein